MRKMRKKKNQFDDLPPEFVDSVNAMSTEEIRDRVATIALQQAELMAARDLDEDLQMAKATAREAGAIYRDGTKMNKTKIEFCKQILGARGAE